MIQLEVSDSIIFRTVSFENVNWNTIKTKLERWRN